MPDKAEIKTIIDEAIEKNLGPLVGERVAAEVREHVEKARLDAVVNGTGLAAERKIEFVRELAAISTGQKAAYLGSSDQAGGYLIPQDVQNEIMRIAATVGIAARDCRSFPMATEALELPIYTGAVMQGAFQGEDTAGSETQNDLGAAWLRAKYWQTIIRFSNILLADASVNIADWVLTLIAEGLAYRMDREVFVGGTFAGSPFVGLLATASTATIQTLGSGNTGFDKLTLPEASDMIGALDTSALGDAAFYMHRTVWAKLRSRSTSGVFEYGQSNLASQRRQNGIQPSGEILGYPVYTTDVLPAWSSSAISTKFAVFANLKLAMAIGDRGPMEIAKSDSAVIGGVSLFERNQTAFRVGKRFAVTQMLGAAAVVAKTAAA